MLTPLRDYRSPRDWKRPWLDPPGFFTGQAGCFCCRGTAAPIGISSSGPRRLLEPSCCPCGATALPSVLYLTLTGCTCLNNTTYRLDRYRDPEEPATCSRYANFNPAAFNDCNDEDLLGTCVNGLANFWIDIDLIFQCGSPAITLNIDYRCLRGGTCSFLLGVTKTLSAPTSCIPFSATFASSINVTLDCPGGFPNGQPTGCAQPQTITYTVTE